MVTDGADLGDFPEQCSEISSSSDSNYRCFLRNPPQILLIPSESRMQSMFVNRRAFHPVQHNSYFNFINPRPTSTPYNQRQQIQKVSTKTAIFVVATIFTCSLVALAYVYFSFPHLEPEERKHIKLPLDIDDAKLLGQVLANHKDRYYPQVITAVIVTFLFLQTFAIPGTLFLSILSGFLFPFPAALLLICFCSATGASLCYLISYCAGRSLVYKYFPDKAAKYSAMVRKHKGNILNYMLFLRITPFLPNWFINIAAPVIDVPLFPFWTGTFIGVAPPSVLAIQAGQTLLELTSASGTWSWTSLIMLFIFALLALVPVFLKDILKKKFE